MSRMLQIIVLLIFTVFYSGCFKGEKSEKPPIHLNPNMDTQDKYKPYRKSHFFPNGSAMRLPVEGSVALGDLRENTMFYYGRDDSGLFVASSPLTDTADLVQRGNQRYEIFCTPCHNSKGDGMGLMINYVYPPATSFHSKRVVNMPDGQLFSVISEGNVLMPSYKHQIPVEDRWAIVSYVRKLHKKVESR